MAQKKTYLARTVATGEVRELAFLPAHFREVGVAPAMAAGIPQLEAYQLINRWNIRQAVQGIVYALAE